MRKSATALRTNESMRALTFATVVIGGLVVLADVFGINFAAPFFDTGSQGFWFACTGMLALLATAVVVGKLRNWL